MESRSAEECFFTDEETAACVDEGGKAICLVEIEILTETSSSQWLKGLFTRPRSRLCDSMRATRR